MMARSAAWANRATTSATTYAATIASPAAAVTETGSGVNLLRDRYFHVGATAVANHTESRRAADRGVLDLARQLAAVENRLAVEADDDIARPQPGACRRGVSREPGDDDPPRVRRAELCGKLRRERRDFDVADRAAAHLAVLLQFAEHLACQVARHREADALVPAALAVNRGIDPDQLAASVDERAARVARVDGGVGLDEVFVLREADIVAAGGGHDAERDALAQLVRVADRQHPLGNLQP